MVADASRPDTKVTVALPTEELETFQKRFPQHGSITWFFREAIIRFNELFDVDPNEAIGQAVSDIELKS